MDKSIVKLIKIVHEQKSMYEELLELAKKKNFAVERGDTKELDIIVEAEELLVMSLGRIEKERNSVIISKAARLNIPREELTVKKWQGATETEKKELSDVQSELLETLKQLDTINRTNQKLISMQLDYVKHVFDNTGEGVKNNSYGNKGTIKRDKSNSAKIVDMRM